VSSGRHPEGELGEHVAACADCADLATVAGAILDERNEAMHEASVPPSGAMWWRIQMRAYHDAQRATTRTITVVQGVALLAAVITIAAILGRKVLFEALTSQISSLSLSLPTAVAITVLLIATPVALWAAMRGDRRTSSSR
jgi:hypothetical protein